MKARQRRMIPLIALLFLAVLLCLPRTSAAGEWSGYLSAEARLFPTSPLSAGQHDDLESVSLAFEPEYYKEWEGRYESFTFKPFIRLDQHDSERSHVDIRELYWEKAAEKWELRLGIRKVYWGVTESQHLVDIINQTDLVENPDGEDKLGQPMVNLALVLDWGTIDLFVLPGFRERTFPGRRGRLRPPFVVDVDHPEFESGAEEHHVDLAIRWSHSLGDWDLGLSHFRGTAREPRLVPRFARLNEVKLIPHYDIINQTGLDLQLTKGGWLWKLEAIARSGQGETFAALTGGFEYTFYGVFGTGMDVGLLAEYLYDSRGKGGPSSFENDLFLGLRLGLNDEQSTMLLAGAVSDPDTGATSAFVEASRRLGESWKLIVEGRAFFGFPDSDPASAVRNDDYIQVEIAWYF